LLQCSWEAAATTFAFSLSNGGPASIVYGSIFAGIGTTLIALSLAEMASMDPTVGAQYRWTAAFAPKWNRFFGLMQGWITVFAWICSCTSNPALISNIIVGLASFNNAEYVPQRWHSTLIMWAATTIPFIGNLWLPKIIDVLEMAGAVCHVGFFFASIITLAVLGDKSSVSYVFRTLTNDVSGWRNPAVAWGIGLLNVTYPLTGTLGKGLSVVEMLTVLQALMASFICLTKSSVRASGYHVR
jgi:choline transport protein